MWHVPENVELAVTLFKVCLVNSVIMCLGEKKRHDLTVKLVISLCYLQWHISKSWFWALDIGKI